MNVAARPLVPLGDFMLQKGGSVDPAKRSDDRFVLYSIPSFDAGKPETVSGHEIGSPKKKVASGDVLLSRIVPHIRRSWIVGDHPDFEILASGEWIVFRSQKIYAPYLQHFLISDVFHPQFMKTVAGVGGSLLRAKPNYVAEIAIPLPPLDEQRRIAAILDKADALRRKRKRALELLDGLTQSIFLEMFGDLIKSTAFRRGRISDWVQDFDTGKNLAPDPDEKRLTGYRVLKVSAVTSGAFRPGEAKPLPANYEPPQSHIVRSGDLLFSRANTTELIGATAYVDAAHDKLVLPDKIWRFIWKKDTVPNPRFIHALFSTTAFRREISKRATGTSGSMKNISKDKVLQIEVALPERSMQDAFVCKQSTVHSLATLARDQLSLMEMQFSSLQHRAFSGQL